MRLLELLGVLVIAVLLLLMLPVPSFVRAEPRAAGATWTCGLDDLGATLTLCQRSGADSTYYITDIVAQSTTTTGGQFILRTGTGTNCGTGTASLLPSAATAARLGYPASTSAPAHLRFQTPITIPKGTDLCVLAVGTNTLTIQVSGYVAP